MKKTILSIAVIAAAFVAASCQKENLQENTASEGSASVFTATIETVAGTKTTVERVDGTPATYKTKWDNGDEIGINGTIFTATPASDATKATFTKKNTGDAEPSGPFKAYFPEKLCIFNFKGILLSLPATYTYVEGKYNMPMYAESDNTTLSFKNLCGVLAITVKGTDFTSVSSIEVSSDQQMNGAFSATAEGVLSFVSKTLEDADKKVTLNFDTAKSIESAGSATFYIPVPAGTHNPLTIKVTGGSTTKTMVTKKSGGVAVARNTVYPITFADNAAPATTGTAKATIGGSEVDVNWVQLWAGGPKFAEYNVGVTDGKAESYGGYYEWADNIASSQWGSNWRMPTADELGKWDSAEWKYVDGLLGKCTCKWITLKDAEGQEVKDADGNIITGLLCTGKGAYASNSVFLPAAGYYYGGLNSKGDRGRYWSSTPGGSDSASYLHFGSIFQDVGNNNPRYNGYSVRAVLAE